MWTDLGKTINIIGIMSMPINNKQSFSKGEVILLIDGIDSSQRSVENYTYGYWNYVFTNNQESFYKEKVILSIGGIKCSQRNVVIKQNMF